MSLGTTAVLTRRSEYLVAMMFVSNTHTMPLDEVSFVLSDLFVVCKVYAPKHWLLIAVDDKLVQGTLFEMA